MIVMMQKTQTTVSVTKKLIDYLLLHRRGHSQM